MGDMGTWGRNKRRLEGVLLASMEPGWDFCGWWPEVRSKCLHHNLPTSVSEHSRSGAVSPGKVWTVQAVLGGAEATWLVSLSVGGRRPGAIIFCHGCWHRIFLFSCWPSLLRFPCSYAWVRILWTRTVSLLVTPKMWPTKIGTFSVKSSCFSVPGMCLTQNVVLTRTMGRVLAGHCIASLGSVYIFKCDVGMVLTCMAVSKWLISPEPVVFK